MRSGIIVILLVTISYLFNVVSAQTLPAGFSFQQVTAGLIKPTAMEFAPDGRIFVCQQDGTLRVIKNGILLSTPAIDLETDINGERGLVGITLHPDFQNNNYVYLYYTPLNTVNGVKRNRIERYKFNGDVIDTNSVTLVLDLDPLASYSNIHNSGHMQFSSDGKLFVSVGDANITSTPQNINSYLGKILRINPDGSAPTDNPFAAGTTPQSKRVWAMGLRNPFTFDIQPGTGRIYVNDVGLAAWEEINDATLPGKNFGWPTNEGIVSGSNFTNPLTAYGHGNGTAMGCAITGGTFFNPTSTNYPSSYNGMYFFMDYCRNWIYYINPALSNPVYNTFASNLPMNSLGLRTGPDGNLYFLSRSNGTLNKIAYSLNNFPVVVNQPISQQVAIGQEATFSVNVSGMPPFSYIWRRNGTPISGANSPSYTIPAATKNSAGTYSVVVTNSAGTTTSNIATLTVLDDTPPVAIILTPPADYTYQAGEVLNFSGDAIDDEDGVLPASSYQWDIEFWHGTGVNQHVHDGPPIATGVKSGKYTIPANNEKAVDVFYRLKLTVTDTLGIKSVKSLDLLPRLTNITLVTIPAGLHVQLDGEEIATPISFQSVEGVLRTLGPVSPQLKNGKSYIFDSWQHGGPSTQTISTPISDVIYTAYFRLDSGYRAPENPVSVAQGINYKYYEGNWTAIPDFSTLKSKLSGYYSTINLNPRQRDSYYGLCYQGFVDIPYDGIYRFYTSSNDGSRLYIGSTLVVNNDGQHAALEQSGTIGLKAGKHAIKVEYFQANGTSTLTVSYSSDVISKREISAGMLYRPTNPSNVPPAVSITAPVSGQSFITPASITIEASAADSNGTVRLVEFYQNGVKIGEDNSVPFNYSLNNVNEGVYELSAKAYDNLGTASVSGPVTIYVSSAAHACDNTGRISKEIWTGIAGQNISLIPLSSSPGSSEDLNVFEAPQNVADNYGTRIRGYICPPQTGTYYFWIASNDNGELWLSRSADESGKSKIASCVPYSNYREWTRMASQKSTGIYLVEGNKYYIEALQKEGVGSDHISVGWQLPDGSFERPIPGQRLIPYSLSNVKEVADVEIKDFIKDTTEVDVLAYPNPAEKGIVTLVINGNIKYADASVTITNLKAQQVYTGKVRCNLQCPETKVDIDQKFKVGEYLMYVKVGDKVITRRLLIK